MSKNITITVYEYKELSKEAKNKAYDDYLNNFYYFADDNNNTLNVFCDLFDITGIDFRCDCYDSYINFDTYNIDENISELTGLRLYKYIWNNYKDNIYNKKTYWKNGKLRISNIKLEQCCPLTGVCWDIDILKPIYDFLKDYRSFKGNYINLIHECLNSWLNACIEDYNYLTSEEYFIEMNNDYDYYYYSDGTLYIEK